MDILFINGHIIHCHGLKAVAMISRGAMGFSPELFKSFISPVILDSSIPLL
jgi:hypothetical protein